MCPVDLLVGLEVREDQNQILHVFGHRIEGGCVRAARRVERQGIAVLCQSCNIALEVSAAILIEVKAHIERSARVDVMRVVLSIVAFIFIAWVVEAFEDNVNIALILCIAHSRRVRSRITRVCRSLEAVLVGFHEVE